MNAEDKQLIRILQDGLPLCKRPYHEIAKQTGLKVKTVIGKLQEWQKAGKIRRIAAVPNHVRAGYRANGMTVWDVPDDRIDMLGKKIGSLPWVTHCYHRPRILPEWPYNLFAMVHGKNQEETSRKINELEDLLYPYVRKKDVLYSTKILKKTGLRL